MKGIKLATGVGLFLLFTLCAGAVTPIGPISFKLKVISQDLDFELISTKTNKTTTTTNITQVYKSSVTNATIDNKDILALLANSFNTNFPVDAQLINQNGNIFVADNTGTNILFDVSEVFSVDADGSIEAGKQTVITTYSSSGTSYSGTQTSTSTLIGSIEYNDEGMTTTDGTHVHIEIQGLLIVQRTVNFKTNVTKMQFQFSGEGQGDVKGYFVIIKGTFKGKASGTGGVS